MGIWGEKLINKVFLERREGEGGLHGVVTELMDAVVFASCFALAGCWDGCVLFSKAGDIQSACQR